MDRVRGKKTQRLAKTKVIPVAKVKMLPKNKK